MLQLMRAFPFPHSNVLFDTQTRDPIGPEKKQSMVYSVYRWQDSDTYAGWEGVESSASRDLFQPERTRTKPR